MLFETERLRVREFNEEDAEFIYQLTNEPDFLRYVGDKNIHDLDAAKKYLLEGPIASYQQYGFGLFLVSLKSNDAPVGTCGLIKRPALTDVDIGYGFLEDYAGNGYATEAAKATLKYGYEELKIETIVAITCPDNIASIRVLQKIGLSEQGKVAVDDREDLLFK
ncbi:GNAT family N-acetyltransferase [Pleionea sp. CnH1-48]|uniref:GNAT family N-acetyltransferase n=1 Tax=Pleionea sp. CnH1-48 TaxID=2954494 RepID=UPI002097BA59|nr:GNAT family N-acetyltransferase [Pleionea sp. CnH1-48]MCO7227071.1 GNAT family N-acetyltransferase [Pleionea sp. CnH1-48]